MYRSQCLVEVVSFRWRNHWEFWDAQRSICTSPCRLVCLSLTAELVLYFYFKMLLIKQNFLTDLLGTFILKWPIQVSILLIKLSLISIILRRQAPILFFSPCLKQCCQSYLLYLYILTLKDENWKIEIVKLFILCVKCELLKID